MSIPTEYHLEINSPGDDRCISASFVSSTPFGAINKGDVFPTCSLNLDDSPARKPLEVTTVIHYIMEIPETRLIHKICVSTKIAEISN